MRPGAVVLLKDSRQEIVAEKKTGEQISGSRQYLHNI